MFNLLKNDINLSFSIIKADTSFGDDSKTLFWIDLDLRALQRGRQEYIPLDSIDRFEFASEHNSLQAVMGSNIMVLYKNEEESSEDMQHAAEQLNAFCGISS